jgi:hypothetical protein
MANDTVRADARTLPNPDHLPPREALLLALLAVREELTAEPVTEKRAREIAASDMLLERLVSLEVIQ